MGYWKSTEGKGRVSLKKLDHFEDMNENFFLKPGPSTLFIIQNKYIFTKIYNLYEIYKAMLNI